MSHFPDVKKGGAFVPSASLENKVRHFFNGSATLSSGQNSFAYANNNRLTVFNNTDKLIPAYTPVYISGRKINNGELWCGVSVATTDEQNWGIVTADLAANGGMGTMVISGAAQAYISGNGQFASPGADGKLVAGSSGKALILHPGDAQTPGIVQLGYSAGAKADNEYKGFFKIIRDNETSFSVVDGSDYDSDYCGYTDVPGCEMVPRTSFPFSGYFKIYLNFRLYGRDEASNPIYLITLTTTPSPSGYLESILVGSVSSDGVITQTLRTTETVWFNKDWYL